MDTFTCELLVHITAASTAKDDRRYVAIAQSVLDFEPAAVTRVDGAELNSASSTATAILDIPTNQGALLGTRFVSFVGVVLWPRSPNFTSPGYGLQAESAF